MDLGQSILTSLVSSAVFAALVKWFLDRATDRRIAQMQGATRAQYEFISALVTGDRKWRESVVTELLGPLYMQLRRTKTAFHEYTKPLVDKSANMKNFREVKILFEGNSEIRRLLLERAHFIPPELLEDASSLVDHLDRWMIEYEEARAKSGGELERFIFAGPQGYKFPREADRHFQEAFVSSSIALRKEIPTMDFRPPTS